MIDVLLATYNGELYVKEQISSILNQTFTDFKLYIRDDGSYDNTMAIINEFSDERIVLINDSKISSGVGDNFRFLMEHSQSEYIVFSDQDDVWLPNKLHEMYLFAKENFNNNTASLAYSSGYVVDSNLVKTGSLTCEYTTGNAQDFLFMNGGIQGCASLINRKSLIDILSLNFDWYMHDQAISLYIAFFGEIYQIKKPLFLYRQHGNNVLGYSDTTVLSKLIRVAKKKNMFVIDRKVCNSIMSFNDKIDREHTGVLLNDFLDSLDSKIHLLLFVIKYKAKLRGSLYRLIFKILFSNRLLSGG
ncbi:glycosyltransferase [Vibrio lentus]